MALSAFDALRRLAPIFCTGALLCLASTPSSAQVDNRCGQLEALGKKYEGVELTAEQKGIKVQMVAWYEANCKPLRRSASR